MAPTTQSNISPDSRASSVSAPTLQGTGTATPLESEKASPMDLTTTQSSYHDEPNWPKGWRPWTCLFGCFLLMFNSWGLVNAYGTFASYYLQHLMPNTTFLLVNLIGSTQSFVVLSLSFIVGRLLDAGHARQLVGVGAVLVTLGMMLISVVNGDANDGDGNYGLIWLTQGLLCGLGMACFFVSSSQIAATWFIKRKAIAIGIVASGASISGLIYPLMTTFLITEVGFNDAVRYVATVVGATALLSFLLAVPNPAHKFRTPEKWLKVEVFFDVNAFRNPSFCWFTAAIAFMFFGFYAVFFNIEEWAASHGFGLRRNVPSGFEVSLPNPVHRDAIRTFWLLSMMNAASTIGRILTSIFCERFGALNIHTICTAIGSVLIFALWIPATSLSPAIAFCVIYGAVSGAIIGLPPASIADILGRNDPKQQAKLGQWTGMMYTGAAIPALTGPVIAGYLISEYNMNFITVQCWAGACLFLAAVCMAIARLYMGKREGLESLRSLRGSLSTILTKEKEEV